MNDEWLKQLEQERREKIEQAKANLFGYLTQHHPHIARIEVEYSGYGDEGDVGDVNCYTTHDETDSIELTDTTMDELISKVFCAVTPDGFENNEGGDGNIHIYPATQKIIVHHTQNVIHQEHETYEV